MQWHMQTKITNRNGAFSIFFSAMNYKRTDAVAIAMPLLTGSTSKCINRQKRTYVQKSKLEQVKLAGERPEQLATSHEYFQQLLLMKLRTTRHTRECLKRYLLHKTDTDICV
jgi:hypothetical protein